MHSAIGQVSPLAFQLHETLETVRGQALSLHGPGSPSHGLDQLSEFMGSQAVLSPLNQIYNGRLAAKRGEETSSEFGDDLPGIVPPKPPWGQETALSSPDLTRRVSFKIGAVREVCIVLGAGGAFAPDLINALLLRGTGAVIGADIQLTYPVENERALYRHLDLRSPQAVKDFFTAVYRWASARGLRIGTVYDLSAVQTSPKVEGERYRLSASKQAIVDALCSLPGDQRLFYMSTAEVYGAPEGPPYAEDHRKEPRTPYARNKWAEEQAILAAHGRATALGGQLRITALRPWTIVMTQVDFTGAITATRNYNDSLLILAEKLAEAGVRLPVVDPELLGTFHLAEEVAEVAMQLGVSAPDASVWGQAYNCIGLPTTHGRLRDICYALFDENNEGRRPWWSGLARLILGRGRLPRFLFYLGARIFEWLGVRDVLSRLPFLYRNTQLDTTALQRDLGDRLTVPEGSRSEEAIRRLATGMIRGGSTAINVRRYRMY